MTCRQLAKDLPIDEWTLGKLTGLYAEDFCTCEKTDTLGYDGHYYPALDKFVNFERELWFDLGKCMWGKHRSVYQDHMKYVRNDILKPFKVKILRCSERVLEMHDLAKYLSPPLMKGESSEAAGWTVRNQEFTSSEVRLAIKDGLPKFMRDELDDHP